MPFGYVNVVVQDECTKSEKGVYSMVPFAQKREKDPVLAHSKIQFRIFIILAFT